MAQSQNNNLDFEDGNFNGWTGYVGSATGFNVPVTPVMIDTGIFAQRHEIMSGSGTDVFTSNNWVPEVSPTGGTYSVRLGNSQPGAGAERLEKTFLVTPDITNFVFQYAVIFEDPGHTGRPMFEAKLFDQNDSIVPCAEFLIRADQSIGTLYSNSVQLCGLCPLENVLFTNWEEIAVDLTDYIGDSLTIQFTTADCNAGDHFGYAYIDIITSRTSVDVDYCSSSSQVTLTAPGGYQTYNWSTAQWGQTISINTPSVGDSIYVYMTPLIGCAKTVTYFFNDIGGIQDSLNIPPACLGDTLTLSDFSTPSSSSDSITSLDWLINGAFAGSDSTVSLPLPGGQVVIERQYTTLNGCGTSIVDTISVGGVSYTPSHSGNCFSDSIILNANTSANAYDSITNYTWSISGIPFGSNPTLEIPPVPADSYTVTLTTVTALGCEDSSSFIITIDSAIANFVHMGNCTSDTLVVTDQSYSYLSSGYTSDWFIDSNYISSGSSISLNSLPAGDHLVTEFITTQEGCTDSASQVITISGLTANIATSGNCVDDSILIQDISTIEFDTITSRTWIINGASTADTSSFFQANIGPGTSMIDLIIVTGNGCVDTTQATIQIDSLYSPSYTVNGCAGENISIQDSSFSLISPITTYTWYLDSNELGSNSNALLLDSLVSGDYNFSLVTENQNGCSDSATVLVSLGTINLYLNSDTICLGETLFPEDSILVLNDSLISSTWYLDGILSASLDSIQDLSQGSHEISIAVESEQGCLDSISQFFLVDEASAQIALLDSTICLEDTTTAYSIGSSNVNDWLINGISVSGDDSIPVSFNDTSTYTIILQTSSSNGCQAYDTTQIAVQEVPEINLPDSLFICEGNNETITVSTNGQSILWSTGSMDSSIVVTPNTNTTYHVTVQNDHCAGTDSIVVLVNPVPEFSPVTDSTICENGSVVINRIDSDSAYFINGNGTIDQTQIILNTDTTTFFDIVYSNGFCSDTSSFLISVDTFPRIIIPIDTIICAGTSLDLEIISSGNAYWQNQPSGTTLSMSPAMEGTYIAVAENGVCQITDSVVVTTIEVNAGFIYDTSSTYNYIFNNLSDPGTYSWDFGDGSVSDLQNPYHEYADSGSYTITLTVVSPEGCVDTSQVTVEIILDAVSEITIPDIFTPNGDGINDQFVIQTVNIIHEELLIYNRWGQLLYSTNTSAPWNGRTLSGDDATEGTYYFFFKGQGLDGKPYQIQSHLTLLR